MYVTRPLSLYLNNPDALYLHPPEGPNSGYLVLQDEESTPTTCFRLCKDTSIRDLPFPQNKLLDVTHRRHRDQSGESGLSRTTSDPVYFIPAINQSLSSNTYYAIKPNGSHKGEAYACSREEDMITCCFCNCVNDVKPRPLDPSDIYQQFKFSTVQGCGNLILSATSAASDGYPPFFLRARGWNIYSRTPKNFTLGEAIGLDPTLRARLPDFDFPLSYQESKSQVVGKWYCPFLFIKELTPKEQVKKSMFYEMTLEQRWERIFFYERYYARSSRGEETVMMDITVPTEIVTVAGTDAMQDHQKNDVNYTVVWFKSIDKRQDESRVGLSSLIVERMMWEEERAGWVRKAGKQEKVSKIDEFGGEGKWTRYGCYMLVERFVLKRMDGSVVLTYSFNHTHQIRSKWE